MTLLGSTHALGARQQHPACCGATAWVVGTTRQTHKAVYKSSNQVSHAIVDDCGVVVKSNKAHLFVSPDRCVHIWEPKHLNHHFLSANGATRRAATEPQRDKHKNIRHDVIVFAWCRGKAASFFRTQMSLPSEPSTGPGSPHVASRALSSTRTTLSLSRTPSQSTPLW